MPYLNLPAIFAVLAVLFTFQPSVNNNYIRPEAAKCYGTSPCSACSNCSSCKHCSSGGTCGVCEKPKTKKAPKLYDNPSTGGQCKATTKKGTRCSRSAASGNYCWQHK